MLWEMSFEQFQDGWQPSWISECMDFSYSEFLCCPDVTNHISAQSNFQFGRRCPLKNFKMAALGCHFGYGLRKYFRNSESQYCLNASYVVLAKMTSGSRAVFSFFFFFFFFFLNNFKMADMAAILYIGTEGI